MLLFVVVIITATAANDDVVFVVVFVISVVVADVVGCRSLSLFISLQLWNVVIPSTVLVFKL